MSTASAVRPARPRLARPPEALFAVTVFGSAALVFLVEPMVAKLVLPRLGGSPSVWNTSLAFFQAALLAGYLYAHLLQKVRSLRTQVMLHVVALAAAALVLPLRISELLGPPSSTHPALWLVGVLAVSIGAPFAVLSATAPLAQAWHARTVGVAGEEREPYTLYAASNLGSLLALLAYPIAVEPAFTLAGQRLGWSAGYVGFIVLMGALGLLLTRVRAPAAAPDEARTAAPVSWRQRLAWVALAAIPSSLMLGVTTHLTTDVASAPFLWVVPLALYLLTFVIAFQARPAIPPDITLLFQAAAVAGCAALLPFSTTAFLIQFPAHLGAFFLTALMCHQQLVARRPDPAQLTDFYLAMSLGGVIGGGFNAFVAPVIFDNVWEYPLVLALSVLARPSDDARMTPWAWAMLLLGGLGAFAAPFLMTWVAPHVSTQAVVGTLSRSDLLELGVRGLLALAVVAAFMSRARTPAFFLLIALITLGAHAAADRVITTQSWRSFFGVLKQSETITPSLGRVRMLAHGTTLHGAQALDPRFRCRPLVYYTPSTPIGQVFRMQQAQKPGIRIGAVGLGTGSVAAYVRPRDHLTFFEIDPMVIRVSTDPKHFSYTTACAKGAVDYVVGDARLTLAKQPRDAFDVLLIDAFSSDAVPAHLLTVEAVRGYLTHLTPDGVLILHLSNRNLDLKGPAQAVARAAGGAALLQEYRPKPGQRGTWESDEDAVIVGRSAAALTRFKANPAWVPADPFEARPWTDDYTNLAGALYRRVKESFTWLP